MSPWERIAWFGTGLAMGLLFWTGLLICRTHTHIPAVIL